MLFSYAVVEPIDFDVERLPAHLRTTFAAVDEHATRVATSTGLVAPCSIHWPCVRAKSVAKVTAAAAPRGAPGVAAPSLERAGLTTWDLDVLPAKLETAISTGSITGYPALVDEGISLAIRVFGTPTRPASIPAGCADSSHSRCRARSTMCKTTSPTWRSCSSRPSLPVDRGIVRKCAPGYD